VYQTVDNRPRKSFDSITSKLRKSEQKNPYENSYSEVKSHLKSEIQKLTSMLQELESHE
jgi:hypothetical protein